MMQKSKLQPTVASVSDGIDVCVVVVYVQAFQHFSMHGTLADIPGLYCELDVGVS
jgi:hypothetical protein